MMNTDSRQTWSPRDYRESAGFVSELGVPGLDWLAPSGGERILDLGCGDGTLAQRLSGMGCEVVGVDSSPEMIEAAKADGLNAFVCDGHELPFSSEFDAVFANAALHWMTGPEAVIAGGWLRTFAQPYTSLLPESEREKFIASVVERLKPKLCDNQGNWTADYVRIRFAAVKPD